MRCGREIIKRRTAFRLNRRKANARPHRNVAVSASDAHQTNDSELRRGWKLGSAPFRLRTILDGRDSKCGVTRCVASSDSWRSDLSCKAS
jgi:hypothetical protein